MCFLINNLKIIDKNSCGSMINMFLYTINKYVNAIDRRVQLLQLATFVRFPFPFHSRSLDLSLLHACFCTLWCVIREWSHLMTVLIPNCFRGHAWAHIGSEARHFCNFTYFWFISVARRVLFSPCILYKLLRFTATLSYLNKQFKE